MLCYFNLVRDESKAWVRENKVDVIKGTVRLNPMRSTTVKYSLFINDEAHFKTLLTFAFKGL